jgi:hypothetical protein
VTDVLRRVVKDDAMGGIAEEGRPALLGVQDARLALDAQIDVQVGLVCHPTR